MYKIIYLSSELPLKQLLIKYFFLNKYFGPTTVSDQYEFKKLLCEIKDSPHKINNKILIFIKKTIKTKHKTLFINNFLLIKYN